MQRNQEEFGKVQEKINEKRTKKTDNDKGEDDGKIEKNAKDDKDKKKDAKDDKNKKKDADKGKKDKERK